MDVKERRDRRETSSNIVGSHTPPPSPAGEQMTSVLQELASALSHDVRTPLRHVNHFLDFFERALEVPLSEEASEHLMTAREQVLNAAEMVEALVAYARLDTKPLSVERVDLGEIIHDAMTRTQMILNVSGDMIEVIGQGEINANSGQLQSLFMHIFENSLIFCPKDRTPQLTVTITHTEDLCTIEISDNGNGFIITQEAAFRLFQSFGSGGEHQGVGVGLPMARRTPRRDACYISGEICRRWGNAHTDIARMRRQLATQGCSDHAGNFLTGFFRGR